MKRAAVTVVIALGVLLSGSSPTDAEILLHTLGNRGIIASGPQELIGALIHFGFGSSTFCNFDDPSPVELWEGHLFTPADNGAVIPIFESDLAEFAQAAAIFTNGTAELICNTTLRVTVIGIGGGGVSSRIEWSALRGSPWLNGNDLNGSWVTDMELSIDELTIGPDPVHEGWNSMTVLYSLLVWGSPPPIQEGDSNLDGVVNVTDLLALLVNWGVCSRCPEDFDGDQMVNVSDLLNLLGNWG